MNGVIFDLDGTILDSMGLWEDIVERYLKSLSVPVKEGVSTGILSLSFAEGAEYIRQNFLPDKSSQEIGDGINDLVENIYKYELAAKEGMTQFISRLYGAGVPMCVATSNCFRSARAALERLGVAHCFRHLFTSDEVPRGKTDPEMYLKAAAYMNSPVAATWVLEDAPHALKSAKGAGFKVALVREKEWEKERSSSLALADFAIDSPADLDTLYYKIVGQK